MQNSMFMIILWLVCGATTLVAATLVLLLLWAERHADAGTHGGAPAAVLRHA
jgi:hypothetical protein